MTFPEIAAVVCDALGRKPPRCLHVPDAVCWTLAAANSLINTLLGLRLLINLDKMREGLAGNWMCDPARLTKQLGFEFTTPVEHRIRETTQCYQKKGWL